MMLAEVNGHIAAFMAICAIITSFAVSGNLLTELGSSYINDGGFILQKIHPATYLAGLSCLFTCATYTGRFQRQQIEQRLVVFFCGISLCILYAVSTTGLGNIIVLLDTFLSAGMLAVTLNGIRPSTQRDVRHVAQLFISLNGVIAIGEFVCQGHLVPVPADRASAIMEFRPNALYDHPLSGATVTMMGLYLAPNGAWVIRWAYIMLVMAALLAFGERTPIVATLLAMLAMSVAATRQAILARDINVRKVAQSCMIAVVFGGAAAVFLMLASDARLQSHLYWDDSAQTRLSQFTIFSSLSVSNLLFGCQRAELLALIEPLRLTFHVAVIENFWLFTFLALGGTGFIVFIYSFLALLKWLWKIGGREGHTMIVLFVTVASASNSLGRKSTLLAMLVSCVIACRRMPLRIPAGAASPC